MLFTRDLRVHDNPALSGACRAARQVVPLSVVDPALAVPPNRARFLAESLAVLREVVPARAPQEEQQAQQAVSASLDRVTGRARPLPGRTCPGAELAQTG